MKSKSSDGKGIKNLEELAQMTDQQIRVHSILVDLVEEKMEGGWLPQKYWNAYPETEKKYKGTGNCPNFLKNVMRATYRYFPIKFIKKYKNLL